MPPSYGYFRHYTHSKGLLYLVAIIYIISASTISLFQPFLYNCNNVHSVISTDFENPGYAFAEPCNQIRVIQLLYLTPEECTFGRRITFAALLGALIGWERRQADRPAGIRTMAVVSLGSCLFSICSQFAFIDGPMGWDASRVSAAIPSGVGFLGAGIIWKQTDKDTNAQSVHGLTTAASLWLSAAVGIACSGGLYFAASFAIAVMMILLRFGPRIIVDDDDTSRVTDFSERYMDVESSSAAMPSPPSTPKRYGSELDEFVSARKSSKKGGYQSVDQSTGDAGTHLESMRSPLTSGRRGNYKRSKSIHNIPSIRE